MFHVEGANEKLWSMMRGIAIKKFLITVAVARVARLDDEKCFD